MNPNDPAFPCSSIHPGDPYLPPAGLTKREFFAAMAMQGAMASPTIKSMLEQCIELQVPLPSIAELAVSNADALINELSKASK